MTLQVAGSPLSIYQIAHNYVSEYMYATGLTYSANYSDLYNLGYYRGKGYYYTVSANGTGPGSTAYTTFPSTNLSMSIFYDTDGNCNCICVCDCACNC